MRTVWKYAIPRAEFDLKLPSGAEILHVEAQDAGPYVWALVDPDRACVERHFHVTGTGHPVPDDVQHVGSWLSGSFVWHLWEHFI